MRTDRLVLRALGNLCTSLLILSLLASCILHPASYPTPSLSPTPSPSPTLTPLPPTETPSPTSTPEPTPIPPIRFAIIGDYGMGSGAVADVAALILSWQPDFIITTGDNNYPSGSAATIDANIGQFFHAFIAPYTGNYGQGATENRFFPVLGNHDWDTNSARPYLDYFVLPGNERYYDFVWEPVHFFALDSDWREPAGIGRSSAQAAWLKEQMTASTTPWQLVYMHEPPYSSGWHGSNPALHWPYREWGADAVLAGHDHTYERLIIDGLVYFVNGLGGGPRYGFKETILGSQMRYNGDYGAMLVTVNETEMLFEFVNLQGKVIDRYAMEK